MMKNLYKSSIYFFSAIFFSITAATATAADTECDSVNNALTSKFRFLGGWNADGTPDYLQPLPGEVTPGMINFVNSTLPESVNLPDSDDEYFGDDIQFNTELNEESDVFLTMVHEGAEWKNTLGYYTYDIENPPATVYDIDSMVVIFPNVSQMNTVQPGNKVLLGKFPAGTGIGYFLIADGWTGDTICLKSHIVFSDPDLNTFTTEAYRQQTILLNYVQQEQLLLCFEDIARPGGDNDFNDAVFYITADPDAIDTTDIPKIPTAHLSGDTTICSEVGEATLKVALSGKAPWTIVYTNGQEEITIADITEEDYYFETTLKDTISLVSVKDKYKYGIPEGEAVINVDLPSATLEDYTTGCGENAAIVNIKLTGVGPWEVAYSINDEAHTAVSDESVLALEISQEGMFELTQVHDANCDNVAEGSAEIIFFETPSAIMSGGGAICNDTDAEVEINLTGNAPFTLVYSDGENETTVTTEENLYQFETAVPGTYTLVSAEDAHCSGDVSGSAEVSDGSEAIRAEIDTEDASCFGEEINLALLGDTDDLTVVWTTDGSGTFDGDDQPTAVYTPSEGETGTVEFFAELDNGCAVKTLSKKVLIQDEPDASFSYSPSKDLLTNSTITFTPEVSDYDEYNWDFGDGNTSTATIASTEYTKGGVYTVSLKVTKGGCENESSTDCEVLSKDELYVPNAFNPGAQNPENRVVKVYGNNVEESGFAFRIVNRWGKTMYETDSFAEANTSGWNGVNEKNGSEQELNVFTYILKGKFKDGQEFAKVGTITQVK